MDTYTIITTPDDGGVYIEQLQAENPLDAFLKWSVRMLEQNSLPGLDPQQFQTDVSFEAEESGPTPVEGAGNVWCAALRGFWVHLVKTAAETGDVDKGTGALHLRDASFVDKAKTFAY
jgi:hypothetical protein